MVRRILSLVAAPLIAIAITNLIGLQKAIGQVEPRLKIDRKVLAEADKLDDEAQALYYAGKYPEAAGKADAACKLAEKAYGGGPGPSAGYYMQRAANLHMILGNMDLAEKLVRDARDKHWIPLRALGAG